MYAPHVFQGMSTEVMVPPSSRVRDRLHGSRPRRSYSARNIRPGSTMEMYWSDVTTLVPNAVARVAMVRLPALRTARRMRRATASSWPVDSMTPPNTIADMTSQIVVSMLLIPPRLSRSSRAALPESRANPSNRAIQHPLTIATGRARSGSATNATTVSPWKSPAKTAPARAPASSAGSAGTRRSTRVSTRATGMSRWGPSAYWASRAASTAASSAVLAGAGAARPAAVNRTSAAAMLGPVVHTMWRMWVNRSVPATAGARLVVSDRADILSPKYAPEMMAPAARPRFSPCAVAMPTSAMPMVPAVVHELPVATETNAQMTHAVA